MKQILNNSNKTFVFALVFILSGCYVFAGPKHVVEPDSTIKTDITASRADIESVQKALQYPENALKDSVQGRVIIRIQIDKDGNPQQGEVLFTASPLLTGAAMKAAMSIKYDFPKDKAEGKTEVWIRIPVVFELKKEPEHK